MNALAQLMKNETGELGVELTRETARHFIEIAKRSYLREIESQRATGNGSGLRALRDAGGAAAPADVTDELEKGGPAFGGFLKSIGLAVADSQAKLDETFRQTAEFLSKQEINVIAVFEQQLNDDTGLMDKGNPVLQKLPLINFFMPTAYQWTRVFLQADMKVAEFNTANGFNIKGKSQSVGVSAKASYGMGGFGASGSASFSQSSFDNSGQVTSSKDEAVGSFHMDATLEPRPDLQPPRPLVLQKGPRLLVSASSMSDIPDPADATKVIGRQVTLSCELLNSTNAPNKAKQLEASVNDSGLYVTLPSPTNDEGKATVTVQRKGAAFDAKKPATAVVARVWFGLVSKEIAFSI